MALLCCVSQSLPNTAADAFLPILTGDIEAAQSLVVLSCESLQVVIDRSLLWFGSIDLAGTHHREEDNVMRVLAPAIASEMLGYIM